MVERARKARAALARLQAAVDNLNVSCVVGVPDLRDGVLYNAVAILRPGREPGRYAKTHLFRAEKELFTPGAALWTGEIAGWQCGVLVCYELAFPEVSRALALSGARLLIAPSAFGRARLRIWQIATIARAIENGCYLAAAGHSGQSGPTQFAGHSRIVDPAGELLADAGDRAEMITAELRAAHRRRGPRRPGRQSRRPQPTGAPSSTARSPRRRDSPATRRVPRRSRRRRLARRPAASRRPTASCAAPAWATMRPSWAAGFSGAGFSGAGFLGAAFLGAAFPAFAAVWRGGIRAEGAFCSLALSLDSRSRLRLGRLFRRSRPASGWHGRLRSRAGRGGAAARGCAGLAAPRGSAAAARDSALARAKLSCIWASVDRRVAASGSPSPSTTSIRRRSDSMATRASLRSRRSLV